MLVISHAGNPDVRAQPSHEMAPIQRKISGDESMLVGFRPLVI
jgi:hypothetical protein